MSPRRREGPRLWTNGFYYFDQIIGFPPHTRRVRFSLRTNNPARAQRLYEQELKARWNEYYGIQTEPAGGAPPIHLADLVGEYITYVRDVKKAKSWRMFEQRFALIQEAWPDIVLGKIGSREIIELDKFLAEKGRSEYTRNHYMGLLKAFFNWAKRAGHYPGDNPIRDFKPYVVNGKRREFTPDEMAKIFAAAAQLEREAHRGLPLYAFRLTRLLALTGMRLGEVINLKWAAVSSAEIRIPRTETKQKKEKAIPLTKEVAVVLDSLRGLDTDFVFPLGQGSRMTDYHWTLKRIREISGIQDFIFHGLRHTAASIMISDSLGHGVGLADIMEILGHSKVETTMRYVHASESRKRTAMGAVADRLSGVKKSRKARTQGKTDDDK